MSYNDEAKTADPGPRTRPSDSMEALRSEPRAVRVPGVEAAIDYLSTNSSRVDGLVEKLMERLIPVLRSPTDEDEKMLSIQPLDKYMQPTEVRDPDEIIRHPSQTEQLLDDVSSRLERTQRALHVILTRLDV